MVEGNSPKQQHQLTNKSPVASQMPSNRQSSLGQSPHDRCRKDSVGSRIAVSEDSTKAGITLAHVLP